MARAMLAAVVIGALLFFSRIVLAQDVCGPGADRALVLSGGGTKGAYEAAVAYHVIVHRGCDFKDFSGVSAGALNVSYLAQAPMGPNSLKNLQEQASALIDVWRGVTDSSSFMVPRFLGALRMLVFGLEGLNDFSPLKELIRKNIAIEKLRASGRHVRVGYTSFYDGGYREIGPGSACLHPEEQDQYLDYVFASALIPVFGDMPVIRQPGDSTNSATWTQFADGGVRHTTPIPGYFPNSEVIPLLASLGAVPVLPDPCGAGEPPPHPKPIRDLFVVVAGPYKRLDDRIERLECNNQPCSQMHDGRDIAMRTVWTALESPSRWDINYAITANNMLKWREELFRAIPASDVLSKIQTRFPVSSFNSGPRYELSYQQMPIITPSAPLTAGTYDVTKQTMLKQLWAGCQDANEAMEKLGGASMKAACEREFPEPPANTGPR
jgi:predicted acylesterase/phospholipase RssA